jgi:hypothetical protein
MVGDGDLKEKCDEWEARVRILDRRGKFKK